MDISTVTDINQLKAMAYDQLAARESAERNLHLLNNRINELLNAPTTEDEPHDDKEIE